jgi:dCMP deaminase
MNSEAKRQYLRKAYQVATKYSPDPSTKVGAIIISTSGHIIEGWNHLPSGVEIDLNDRDLKYKMIEHAERAAIFYAARKGIALEGATMVCPWAACADCARAIAESGFKEVVCHGNAIDATPERWRKDIEIATIIFKAAGVPYTHYYGDSGQCENLFDGQIWHP